MCTCISIFSALFYFIHGWFCAYFWLFFFWLNNSVDIFLFLFVKIKSGKLEPHDVWVKLLLVNLEFVVVLLRFYSLPPDIYMTSTSRHNDGIHTNSIQHGRFPVIDQNMIDVFPLSSNIWLTNKHFFAH